MSIKATQSSGSHFPSETSRRRFLQGALGGAACLPVTAWSIKCALADHAVFTRRNVYDLLSDEDGNDHPTIAAYKQAIDVMKSRPSSDPTSWAFQANIHGSTSPFPNPAWNQCQHGSFFFLSWHRMYLYFFERIVREASGDPDFVLPYWNYSDDERQRALPEAFRVPVDPMSNPLFVNARRPEINDGFFMTEDMTRYDQAFALTNFTPVAGSPVSFGGVEVSNPTQFNATHSELESQPHDILHVIIGGNGGLMTDPNTAAQDPIFWLHHANIDRLWERWADLGNGRSNPTGNADWHDTPFQFFDENGNAVQLSSADIIEVVGQLGYTYDDAPILPILAPGPEILLASAEAEDVAMEPIAVAQSEASKVRLGAHPLRVSLQPTAAVGLESLDATEELGSVQLVIQDIVSSQPIGAYYQVYVNLPADTPPDPSSIYYAGNFSFFGRVTDPNRCANAACGQIFDITRVAERQVAEGVWQGDEQSITFVLTGLSDEAVQLPENAEPEVGQIKIMRQQ